MTLLVWLMTPSSIHTLKALSTHPSMVYRPIVTIEADSTDFNERVGSNVQRFRKAAGMSQADLAHALSQRGASFQQQTVLKVEGMATAGAGRGGPDRGHAGAARLRPARVQSDAGELVEAAIELNKANRGIKAAPGPSRGFAGELQQLDQEVAQADAAQRVASERFEAAAGDDHGAR